MKRIILTIFTVALATVMLFGCGKSSETTEDTNNTDTNTDSQSDSSETEGLNVVTTLFYQYDFAKQIAGDNGNVELLLRPGQESHSYEPTPQDIIAIQEADLFIYNGTVSETWVEKVLEGMDTDKVTVLSMMDYVDVKEEEIVEGMEDDEEHDEDEADADHEEEEEVEYDEHIWTSPVIAQDLLAVIAETMEGLDADNKDVYAANADSYKTQLQDLDAQFKEVVDNAQRKTIVFGDRFPLRYFVDEYGLSYYAAFPGCSTETEPSPATIAFLTNEIKEEAIPVVYYLELSNETIADTLCENTGAKKLEFHSCHNVTQEEMDDGETYITLMERNVEALRQGLE
ncbi:MAG: metal ABC transporter substrate-binding protein [Lachnospiraceae bacterium]